MKKIEAIIQPFRVAEVQQALEEIGVGGLTVSDVKGHGRQGGHTEVYRGQEYDTSFRAKVKVEVVVSDRDLDEAVEAVVRSARTGRLGDGKVFVVEIAEAIRIRDGNRDDSAV
jgi:nitrogen regulatory protein P-II 1